MLRRLERLDLLLPLLLLRRRLTVELPGDRLLSRLRRLRRDVPEPLLPDRGRLDELTELLDLLWLREL